MINEHGSTDGFKKTFTKENLEELGIGKPIDTSVFTDITEKIPGNLKRNIYIPISIYAIKLVRYRQSFLNLF